MNEGSDEAEVGEGAGKGGNNLILYTHVRNSCKRIK